MNINEFVDAIANAGLGCPDVIADGQLHRFATPEDKHQDRSGWYVLHGEVGVFGDWRTGIKETWNDRSKPLTENQRAQLKASRDAERRKRQALERSRHEAAAIRAQELWSNAAEPMWHDYLKAKKILPLGIRQHNDLLVVPMFDIDGRIWSAQTIDKDGNKRFLPGGRKKGHFFRIGDPPKEHLYIAEGFATGATIHMHMDEHAPVFVAFDAGNLKPVAQSLRRRYPKVGITIAADNDCWKDHNTGLIEGREAAKSIGAELIFPTWAGVDVGGKPTDFNDLYCLGGLK